MTATLPPLVPAPGRPFGIYVHVPFCATRCGYCDFNTYTADELGEGTSPAGWLEALRAELELAARTLAGNPPVETVFVGGGTPSLLGGSGLAEVLDAIGAHFVLAPGAEVTTEANPESTSPAFFDTIRAAGYTRVSLGMQSAAPHVLATLDRVHAPGRAVAAAREARAAGLGHVNLDLIYGTPVRPTTTCAGPSPPCSRPGSITCRHMRWWSRRALPWRGACAAVSCPIPTRTRWPTVTSCWMPRSPRPGWTGTRSPTGRGPAGNAVTTSVTGRVVTGGAPVRGPMGTSTGCGGGTSSTPTPMPDSY